MENVSSATGTEGQSAGERVLEGTGAAPGVAMGAAFRYDASAPAVRQETVAPDAVDQEVELFADGVQRAQQELETIRAVAPEAAEADTDATRREEARRLAAGAEAAHEAGLRVHAGHGLDYNNFPLFQNTVPHVAEVSIGFAVMARAILGGMESAVRDMSATVKGSRA